jgi:hypothetical protein
MTPVNSQFADVCVAGRPPLKLRKCAIKLAQTLALAAVKQAKGQLLEGGNGVRVGGWVIATRKGPITRAPPPAAQCRRTRFCFFLGCVLCIQQLAEGHRTIPWPFTCFLRLPSCAAQACLYPQRMLSWRTSRSSCTPWRRLSSSMETTICGLRMKPAGPPSGAEIGLQLWETIVLTRPRLPGVFGCRPQYNSKPAPVVT